MASQNILPTVKINIFENVEILGGIFGVASPGTSNLILNRHHFHGDGKSKITEVKISRIELQYTFLNMIASSGHPRKNLLNY